MNSSDSSSVYELNTSLSVACEHNCSSSRIYYVNICVIITYYCYVFINCQGYTIPLDKRLAADGRGLQPVHINENFAKLAEALYIADRKAREAVEMRAQIEKKLAQKEKEKREENLRQLAQKARDERAGIRRAEGWF